uniref:Uncharacterized protein n=1 Tax=Medicago truncatula TaxID=3880 RepID=B7FMT5_MEDTR|nr:unknown [Medicago truncatula]AFK34706.1 unknown [Medicago truncatula]
MLCSPQWWRNQYHAISPNKQEWNCPLCSPDNFFVCLIINFNSCNNFFNITKNHIKMLIISMKFSTKLSIRTEFNVDTFVETQPYQIQRLLHCAFFLCPRHSSSSSFSNTG